MKKLLLLFAIILLPMITLAQFVTTNPDTVCYQTNGSIYNVPNTVGYTYNWAVTSPGILQSGQGTNQINVDWSNASTGLIPNAITVSASMGSCVSTPVLLDVFIYQVTPTITQVGPFCSSDPCIALVGSPILGVFTGVGVVGNQFCPGTAGVGSHLITYTYTSGGCVFVTSITVVVNALPVLTQIQHN